MQQDSNRKSAAPPYAPRREMLTHGWGLGAEAQASEAETQGEDWGWLCGDSPKSLDCGHSGYTQKAPGLTSEAGHPSWGPSKDGVGPHRSSSPYECSQAPGHLLQELWAWG